MSDEKKEPTEAQKQTEICMWCDNESDPTVMMVTIPIKELAKNPMGTIVFRGFIEEVVKGNGLFWIKKNRMNQAQGKILTPGSGIGGNGQGSPIPLTVN